MGLSMSAKAYTALVPKITRFCVLELESTFPFKVDKYILINEDKHANTENMRYDQP